MATTNLFSPPYSPFGFTPSQYLSGAPWNQQTADYSIDPTAAAAIFRGDPVVVVAATGTIAAATAGGNTAILGVFYGCTYTNVQGTVVFSQIWPGITVVATGTTPTAHIVDDPSVLFDCVANSSVLLGVTNADFQKNFPYIVGAGSTSSGQSGYTLDANTANINDAATLKVMRLTPIVGNLIATTANRALVLINNHYYKAPTASVV